MKIYCTMANHDRPVGQPVGLLGVAPRDAHDPALWRHGRPCIVRFVGFDGDTLHTLAVREWRDVIVVPVLPDSGDPERDEPEHIPFRWDGTEYDVGDGPVRIHLQTKLPPWGRGEDR